jgi:TolB protein
MSDLRDRFGELDRIALPDLDEELRRPRLQTGPVGWRGGRVLTVVLALVVASAGLGLATWAFSAGQEPSPRPAATVTNGQLAFSGGGQIHVVSPDGSGLQQLTHLGGHDALDVHWSPDGSKLAFRVWTNENYQLYVMNADGTAPTNLTGSMGVSELAWSPDGAMLAFTSFQKGNDFDVFVVNADGTGLRPVVESSLGEHRPQWSPDGTRIAFERWPLRDSDPGTPDIYIVDLAGGEAVPLVTSPGWDTSVAWSPDGDRLAFEIDQNGDREIYVVEADGTGQRQLTDIPEGGAARPAWSPDGTRLSFVAHDAEQWDAWVVNADGTGLIRLTSTERDDGPAVWSPDGRLLAFTSSEVMAGDNTGTYDVYTIRPDGTDERRITSGSFAMGWDLDWQPVVENAPSPTVSPSPTEPPADTRPLNARVTATIEIGAFPRAVALGDGVVWATVDNANGGPDDHLLVKIDPATNEVVGTTPVFVAGDIAVGDGAVWVTSRLDNADGAVLRIDPSTNQVVASISVGLNPSNVAVGEGAVWVTVNTTTAGFRPSGEVVRIDPATNEVVARTTINGGWPRDIVVGEGAVWVYGHAGYSPEHGWESSSLWRIDPLTNELASTVLDQTGFLGDGSYLPDNVAVADGWLWAASDRGKGLRIDPATGTFTTFDLSESGFGWPFLAYEGHVFFGLEPIRILDTETLEVVGSIALESQVADAALDPATGTLWIANYEGSVTRVDLR